MILGCALAWGGKAAVKLTNTGFPFPTRSYTLREFAPGNACKAPLALPGRRVFFETNHKWPFVAGDIERVVVRLKQWVKTFLVTTRNYEMRYTFPPFKQNLRYMPMRYEP